MKNTNNVSHRCWTPRLFAFHSDSVAFIFMDIVLFSRRLKTFVEICCLTLSLCNISSNFTVLSLSNAFYSLQNVMCSHIQFPSPVKQNFSCWIPSAHDFPSHDAMSYIDRNDRSKEAILSNPPLSPLISLPDTTSTHITQITQLHIQTEQHPTITVSSGPPLLKPQTLRILVFLCLLLMSGRLCSTNFLKQFGTCHMTKLTTSNV